MLKRNSLWAGLFIAMLFVGIVGFARAQDTGDPFNGVNAPGGSGATTVFSRVRIIELDGDVFRLDTQSGALSRFRGTLTGRNARGTFDAVADPVSGSTSGFVDIQRAGDAIFLVDVVTGETWILRERGNIAAWVRVNVRD